MFVGNFGGLDSSIEITALGSPVNFLSRLDDLTKAPVLAEKINTGDILLSERTHDLIRKSGVIIDADKINLTKIGLSIRDFPEEAAIYRVTPTDAIYESLLSAYDQRLQLPAESLIGRNRAVAV